MPVALPGSVIQFGEYQLDCGRFELMRNGRFIRVERKPMELLVLLASREGKIVTRAEIAQRLWSSEVFVDTEHGINTAIGKLRHVLRDDPDRPRFIQTVTGMGYRFIAPVSPVIQTPAAEAIPEPTPPIPPPAKRSRMIWYLAAAACAVLIALATTAAYRLRRGPHEVRYTQLTDFTDSASGPALSPDGRMVAFIRGSNPFLSTDQIYVKMLPNGEARQVTHDDRPKYGLAFSPDGSEIAYTVLESSGFSTYVVSALGGEPHLLLKNAAGLVWLDSQHLLFSEAPTGIHLGVVTATVTRADPREIYFPAHERGMAHYSFPSPDRRWALVVEMKGDGGWAQCRLVALQNQTPSKEVGPTGACTSAAWSPDGAWMYFTAWVQGKSHIWRQHFPEGTPEQITSGPMDESGIAVEPTGDALITSVGVPASSIWIHDTNGESPLSSEGEVLNRPSPPVFNRDTSVLYYLLRQQEGSGAELWRTVIDSRKSEAVFPEISMTAFDISPDNKQVVFTTGAPDGSTRLWLAPLDRSSPATEVNISGALSPRFGPNGLILFQRSEGDLNYLEQISPDGSHHSKAFPYPIEDFMGISPNRRWAVAGVAKTPGMNSPAIVAIPLDGGNMRRICDGFCLPSWSPDGQFLVIPVEPGSRTSPGRSLEIPLGPAEDLPDLPPGGIEPLTAPSAIRGARSVQRASLVPGNDSEHYAWVNTTFHRNLYRISLP